MKSSKRSPRSRRSASSGTLDLTSAHPALARIIQEAFTVCAPPPDITVSTWADEHRVLGADTPRPGRWKTSTMEPMRAIMDATRELGVREIVLKKGTQVGYTEFLLNTVGYFIDLDPCPILWLLPDQKAVEEISKNRLTPMLRDTPRLHGKVAAPRSRDSSNTISGKQFPGGRLAMVGSHAPNDISSRPIRLVICDETDRYAISAGVDGDPMALASKRQQWFSSNRLTIKGSSPTTKARSVIDREYRKSDMRECWVPCPHCADAWNGHGDPPGGWQVLKWSQVKWDKAPSTTGKGHEHLPATASYACEHCGALWDDEDRYKALSTPKWIATAPFRGVAGFHLPQFYSTAVRLSEVVTEFLTAWGKLPGTSPDVELQKVWVNTVLAEAWEEKGETVDATGLGARAEPYGVSDVPDRVVLVTAGVDVQADRLEAQAIGWGAGEESWALEYRIFTGDPAQRDVWAALDDWLLSRRFQRTDGVSLRIRAACVDTGGHHSGEVHKFCRAKAPRRVYAIKGADGARLIWPGRASRAKNGSDKVYIVGVDTAKDQIYGRLRIAPRADPLRIDEPHPGRVHFPLADDAAGTALFTDDYYAQLTAEVVVTKYRLGKPYRVWENPRRARNEALDTFVYALAARMSLPIRLGSGVRVPPPDATTVDEDASTVPTPPDAAAVPAPVAAVVRRASMPPPRRARVDPAAIARMFR